MERRFYRAFIYRYFFFFYVGTIPANAGSWQMRWDTPSTNDSALLEIFIQLSNAINVFVGTKPKDPNYQYVPAFTSRDPTLLDVAGAK